MVSMVGRTQKTEMTKDELMGMSKFLYGKCGGSHIMHVYKIDV